jgi:hypothetical protein
MDDEPEDITPANASPFTIGGLTSNCAEDVKVAEDVSVKTSRAAISEHSILSPPEYRFAYTYKTASSGTVTKLVYLDEPAAYVMVLPRRSIRSSVKLENAAVNVARCTPDSRTCTPDGSATKP